MKTAIGLMSGTSMDGIDVAMLSSDGDALVEYGPSLSVEYSPKDRALLQQALEDAVGLDDRDARPGCLSEVEQMITDRHISALQTFLGANGLRPSDIDLVGFHGQTVLHRPQDGLTVQIGDGARLAHETGINSVYDMRAADMTAGGQGAPLVPVYHQALAQTLDLDGPVCFVNIGGISNITYLRDGDPPLAFDTGPGNALIDQWMQTTGGIPFDAGGAIASEGQIVASIVKHYMASPYFKKALPKSLDRLDFKPLAPQDAELSDGARSLARVSAEAIMSALDHMPEPPRHWIICGGGRLNRILIDDLHELANAHDGTIHLAEALGLDGDMLEAQAFAYLAIRSLAGLPLTFPSTTGCDQPITGGVFAPAQESVAE